MADSKSPQNTADYPTFPDSTDFPPTGPRTGSKPSHSGSPKTGHAAPPTTSGGKEGSGPTPSSGQFSPKKSSGIDKRRSF